jgi:hypothetical protein
VSTNDFAETRMVVLEHMIISLMFDFSGLQFMVFTACVQSSIYFVSTSM